MAATDPAWYFPPRNGRRPEVKEGRNYDSNIRLYMTPASRADDIAQLLVKIPFGDSKYVVVDATAGYGGASLAFLAQDKVKMVLSHEIDPVRRRMLENNIMAYGLGRKSWVMGAFGMDYSTIAGFVLYFDPPWQLASTNPTEKKYLLSGMTVGGKTVEEWMAKYANQAFIMMLHAPPDYVLNPVDGWSDYYVQNFPPTGKAKVKLIMRYNTKPAVRAAFDSQKTSWDTALAAGTAPFLSAVYVPDPPVPVDPIIPASGTMPLPSEMNSGPETGVERVEGQAGVTAAPVIPAVIRPVTAEDGLTATVREQVGAPPLPTGRPPAPPPLPTGLVPPPLPTGLVPPVPTGLVPPPLPTGLVPPPLPTGLVPPPLPTGLVPPPLPTGLVPPPLPTGLVPPPLPTAPGSGRPALPPPVAPIRAFDTVAVPTPTLTKTKEFLAQPTAVTRWKDYTSRLPTPTQAPSSPGWITELMAYVQQLLKPVVADENHLRKMTAGTQIATWVSAFSHETFSAMFNYEDLELDGDAVLANVFKKYLRHRFTGKAKLDRNAMTAFSHKYLAKMALRDYSTQMKMGSWILIREADVNTNVLEDVFEAFLGAIQATSNSIYEGTGEIIAYRFMSLLYDGVEMDTELLHGLPKTRIIQYGTRLRLTDREFEAKVRTMDNGKIETVLTTSTAINAVLRRIKPDFKGVTIRAEAATKKAADAKAFKGMLDEFNRLGLTIDKIVELGERLTLNTFSVSDAAVRAKTQAQKYVKFNLNVSRSTRSTGPTTAILVGTNAAGVRTNLAVASGVDARSAQEAVLKAYMAS